MSDDENPIELVYMWLDEIPFTRLKKNITRDFADGVLMAQLLKYFYPRYIDLHNYSPVNSLTAKISNWQTLNKKVLTKLHLSLSEPAIKAIASGTPGAVENLLISIKNKTEQLSSDSSDHGGDSGRSQGSNSELQEPSVPMHVVQNLKTQIQNYKDTIASLNQKISYMEKLIDMKENVINELRDQLQRFQRSN